MWLNRQWIRSEIQQGSRVIDIGEPSGMPPSAFYNMEIEETQGYWNYYKDSQP
jgi:hypothetical protein